MLCVRIAPSSTLNIPLLHRNKKDLPKLSPFASWPAPWLTHSGSNYPCPEQISVVPKMFEPLRFNCTSKLSFPSSKTNLPPHHSRPTHMYWVFCLLTVLRLYRCVLPLFEPHRLFFLWKAVFRDWGPFWVNLYFRTYWCMKAFGIISDMFPVNRSYITCNTRFPARKVKIKLEPWMNCLLN